MAPQLGWRLRYHGWYPCGGTKKLAHLQENVWSSEFDLTPHPCRTQEFHRRDYGYSNWRRSVPDATNKVTGVNFLPQKAAGRLKRPATFLFHYYSLLVFAAYECGVRLINTDPHS
jgi:hypothetical protein